MRQSGFQRVLRAVTLTWVVLVTAHSGRVLASPANSDRTDPSLIAPVESWSTEPFGIPTSQVTEGGVYEKWLGVSGEIDDEMLAIGSCEFDRAHCASSAAFRFLAMVDVAGVREGRARLGEINRAVNLAIRPMSDLAAYGVIDIWSAPLTTLSRGAGDCEDYAIAKFVALRASGVAADDLRIVILRDDIHAFDHAVVAARLDGRWVVLDNRRLVMVDDTQFAGFRPLFAIGSSGVRRYEALPMLVAMDRSPPAPAAALQMTAQVVTAP